MKFPSLVTLAALSLAAPAFAQTPPADHTVHHPAALATASPPLSDGEVRKVDKEQGRITLRHGPIADLDMPGMTMVFRVADPKLLEGLKPSDKVKFAANNLDGALTVTAIEVAK
jgi:Cu(I)/Ag(I) efflux system protein CusF